MPNTLPITIADTEFTDGLIGTTPLAKIATRFSEAVINTAWSEGKTSKDAFSAKITAAMTDFLAAATTPHVTAGSVSVPTIAEPAVDIPSTQNAGDIMTMFDTKYLEIVDELHARLVAFRTTFYPNDVADFAAYESWVTAALANPTAGMPATVQAQIMSYAQARVLSEKVRAQDAVVAQFASRRFPLPPGASASAVLQIEQKAQDDLAAASRDITKMSVEMVKFTVDKAEGLRKMAMDEAIKYISALASGPDVASRLVGIGYDAQSKLISSASQFYGARTQAVETLSKIGQYNTSLALDGAAKNQAADLQMVENKLKALLTEAQAIGQMATSLFNNVHAAAGVTVTV